MRVVLNDNGGYQLDQEEALNDLLHEHGLSNANSTLVPIGFDCYEIHPSDNALLEDKGKNGLPTDKELQSLVGSLLWVARCTRPDIVFAVHKATHQTHQPLLHDWKLAKRVTRYLKGTKSMKLNMTPSENDRMSIVVENYSDADFASDKSDRKSLTGGIIFLNGMAVSWCAKKQGGVSLSIMEGKFVAASEVARELLGIREMLCKFGAVPKLPMSMHFDNQAAIRQLEIEASSLKAKHIDVRVKFVYNFARRGIVLAL
uniref:Uncharacterized protein n=1 Tax=Peronospora matthiolae TaxID=2874970 RepID=A0AAV1UA30_9STRA